MLKNIDIYDENDQPTGRQTSIDYAMKHGLWHRGVHVVIVNKSGNVLLQKRSTNLLFHPGFLDMGCGGFVDAGESPEIAALREAHEEYGLTINPNDLQFLWTSRKNRAWPHIHRHDRAIMYYYAALVETEDIAQQALQKEEVSWAGFVTPRQARMLLRRHSLKSIGRIDPYYKLYAKLLRAAERMVQSQ